MRAILWRASGNSTKATQRAARVGQVGAFLFIAFGLLQFFTGAGLSGLWIAFIGWFLLDAAQVGYVQATGAEELQDVRVAT